MRKSILTIFFVFTTCTSAFSQWNQTAGPRGGEAWDIFNIGSELFISMGNGGIYKSVNKGDSWEWSSNGFPCNTGVTAFFEHNGILYVSLWYNGIYKSSNKGASWEPINNGISTQTFYDIYVDRNDIYASSSEGRIFYSANGGNSWTDKTNGIAVIGRTYQDYISFNNKIYAGGLNLYESSNSGDSWTLVNVPGLGVNGVRSLFEDNGVFYIGGDGLIHVSRDNLTTWDVYNIPFPAGTILNIYKFGNRVYFTNAQGKYYYTDDDGQNWTEVSTNATNYSITSLHVLNNKIIIGTRSGVYESYDNGISWELNNAGIKAANISVLGQDNNYIYANAISQGMFRSSNNGQTWEEINNGLNTLNSLNSRDILTLGNSVFIATGGGVFRSTNNGDFWENKFNTGVNGGASTIDYSNGLLLMSVNLDFYSSSDNGETWNLIPNNLNNPNRGVHTAGFQNNVIILFDGEDVFVSEDTGNTFTKRNFPNGYAFAYDFEMINNRIFASTTRGLFISDNFGVSWQQLHNDPKVFTDIVIESDVIYAASETGVYVTKEDKQKWYPLCDGIGGQFVNKLMLNNDTFFAGAFNSSVWSRSKDNLDNVFDASDDIKTLSVCISSGSLDLTEELTGSVQSGGQWTPALSSGANIFDPSIDTSGTYEYQYAPNTSFCNCNLSLKIDITVTNDSSAGLDTNLTICNDSGVIDLLNFIEGAPVAGGTWSPSLNSGSSFFDPLYDSAGTYTYTVSNSNCGSSSAIVTIALADEYEILDYTIETSNFSGSNTLKFHINFNKEYEYSIDGFNYQRSNIFADLPGDDFNVYAREINGCGYLETVVTIMDFPKFFTPNGDGYNDVWKLRGTTEKNYHVFIFDRYGKLLKQMDEFNKGWDGTYNGYLLPSTDYWYKIYFEDGSIFSGHFSLKR